MFFSIDIHDPICWDSMCSWCRFIWFSKFVPDPVSVYFSPFFLYSFSFYSPVYSGILHDFSQVLQNLHLFFMLFSFLVFYLYNLSLYNFPSFLFCSLKFSIKTLYCDFNYCAHLSWNYLSGGFSKFQINYLYFLLRYAVFPGLLSLSIASFISENIFIFWVQWDRSAR